MQSDVDFIEFYYDTAQIRKPFTWCVTDKSSSIEFADQSFSYAMWLNHQVGKDVKTSLFLRILLSASSPILKHVLLS